jgi:uncharacterized protein (DUF58 family)
MPDDDRFDPSTLARYGRLSLIARLVVEGFLSGVHKSPYKGFSVEFAEHRQYYPGDEIRHIDWRAFGKTDRYYIKEHEEETNLQAHLLVDASGSMAYRGRTVSKFRYAQFVAASLAYLLLNQRDAVGLAIHDHLIRHQLPPRANAKQLPRLLDALEQTAPGGETSLAPLWHRLAGQLERRGLIVILSDCFDELPHLLHALRHLRHRGNEVLLFHILAPEEIEFPFDRLTQFRNLERGADQRLVEPHHVREQYLQKFGRFCEELRTQVAGMQIDYHLLRTDAPVDRALGLYLTRRQTRGAR